MSFGQQKSSMDGREPEGGAIAIAVGQLGPEKARRKVSPSELPFSPPPADSARADRSPARAAPVPQVPKPPLRAKRRHPPKLP